MEKITVIGGGASGLIAAIYAKTENNEVTILERNPECGKKILITGNGRCNYWNQDQAFIHYHSKNQEKISSILTKENQQEILSFFDQIGIIPKIKNGYYYPFSNQAVTIQHALIQEAKKKNVTIIKNCLVTKLTKNKDKFFLTTSMGKMESDKVIIATGSYAHPKTGSTGIGYELAKKMNHTIIPPLPSLVQLKADLGSLKKWKGIRTDAILTLIEDDQEIRQEQGEVQLTEYGISGICTLNLSYHVAIGLASGKKERIKLNFFPFFPSQSPKQIQDWLSEREKRCPDDTLGESLEKILNYQLVDVLLHDNKEQKEKKWHQLTEQEQEQIIKKITALEISMIGTNSFEEAQVCSGGVPLTEIKVETMESQKIKNLYFTGEILDVVGDCGGYNLSFAWISGMLAGKAVRSNQ